VTYLLDTPVLSELVKRAPNRDVVAWVDAQDEDTLFVSVLTLGELHKGVARLPDSARKQTLRAWLTQDLVSRFRGRILSIDRSVAQTWGELQGEAERHGRPLPAVDCLIAATARVHGLVVVTRNVEDMQRCSVAVANPWQPDAS
jgi:predicted nucleic acid-binding protein